MADRRRRAGTGAYHQRSGRPGHAARPLADRRDGCDRARRLLVRPNGSTRGAVAMTGDSLAGKAAIVGIGHTAFGRRGEFAARGTFAMACEAVAAACADAGIDPADVDGWSSYSDDAAAANQLAMAFGAKRFRYAAMAWGGGGSGICGAFLNAAMAVATGQADHVVVARSICQGEGGRFGQALAGAGGGGLPAPFSFSSPYGP